MNAPTTLPLAILAALAALLTVTPVTAEETAEAAAAADAAVPSDHADHGQPLAMDGSAPCPWFEYWLKPQVGYRIRPECLPLP